MKPADDVVCGKTNGRTRVDPNNPSKRFLRVGTDQPSNFPGNLLRFGRNPLSNDVILGEGWSKDDQCYFDYHPTTNIKNYFFTTSPRAAIQSSGTKISLTC